MSNRKMSIVIPAYNEEETVEIIFNMIKNKLQKENILFNIIFIDDGSSDDTWKIIKKLNKEESNLVSGIKFSKNFGQSYAILAGLSACEGDCAVVMDCDGQNPVSAVIEMYKMWKNNDFDIVEGRKKQRQKEGLFYKISAKIFYKILKMSSGMNIENFSDFKLLDRKVIDVIKDIKEKEIYFKAIPELIGFNTTYIYYDVMERVAGKTKYSALSLIMLSINSITSHSSIPMQLVTFSGILFFIFAVVLTIQSLFVKFSGNSVEGFTTVIILLLMVGSIIMFSLGIIGIYISKIYNEVKYRPRYIISERTND